MATEAEPPRSPAELLAQWRAAGRDTVAARAAAHVAELALAATAAALAAANEVEAAAKVALETVEKARTAARLAQDAAAQAAEAAASLLEDAGADKVRANHQVELAERAEGEARDAYHEAVDEAHGRQ